MKARQTIIAKCYDKKGRLLSVGMNSYRVTHPMQKYFAERVGLYGKEYLHAEILAMLRAKGQSIYSLTVERYSKDGQPMMAKPCPICQEAIKAFGVKHVSWTTGV